MCVVVLCWIDHVWFSEECVCCACDPNERLSAPSIWFVCVLYACMSGTRGSGVLSSTGDVLVRGVGGVCDMCMCLARGGVGGEGVSG